MVINRKYIFISMIILLIASLGVISATDISDNDTSTDTVKTTEQTNTNTVTNHKTTTDTKPIKTINKTTTKNTKQASQTAANYDELKEALTTTTDTDLTVTLTGYDYYKITDTITLNQAIKNLIIEAESRDIDGNDTHAFLNITHACNVEINNIFITDCISTTNGAVINQQGGTLTIRNSMIGTNEVVSNISELYGGAIATNNTDVTIENVTFYNNHLIAGTIVNDTNVEGEPIIRIVEDPDAEYPLYGGAISFTGTKDNTLTIKDSIFNENGDYNNLTHGGAIFINAKGKTTLSNNTFINNTAYEGSAILYQADEEAELEIKDSNFTMNGPWKFDYGNPYYDNRLNSTGGALMLYANSTVRVTNTNFTENLAGYGGAIAYTGSDKSSLEIKDSEFQRNNAYFITEIINEPDYDHKNNSYYEYGEGGALLLNTDSAVLLSNSYFKYNLAGNGGAIAYTGLDKSSLEIKDSQFESNYASYHNGKYEYIYNETGSFERSENYYSGDGGALMLTTNNTVRITNTNFTYNGAGYGGAILYDGSSNSNLEIIKSIFEENYAYASSEKTIETYINEPYSHYKHTFSIDTGDGGALDILSKGNTSIIDSNFTYNNARSIGGAIQYHGTSSSNLEIDNAFFYYNGFVVDETGPAEHVEYAGAMNIFTYGNTTIKNSIFTYNQAENTGALEYESGISSSSAVFEQKQQELIDAGYEGIELEEKLIEYLNELSQQMDISMYDIMFGMPVNNHLIMDNNTFDENSATDQSAGALTIHDSYNTTIKNNNFISNEAPSGAADITSSGTLLIENTEFTQNLAWSNSPVVEATAGGLTLVNYGNATIKDTTFTSNVGRDGGAVDYLGDYDTNLNIINSTFEDNRDDDLRCTMYDIDLEHSSSNGGALNLESLSNITITDSTFKENNAVEGGAIKYVNYGEGYFEIKNSTFDTNGNENSLKGGAVYIDNDMMADSLNVNIKNNTFKSNDGIYGSAIFFEESSNKKINITDSVFDSNGNNNPELYMTTGAITLFNGVNTELNIDNTNFTNNTARFGSSIYYEGLLENNITINNSTFDKNGNKDTSTSGSVAIRVVYNSTTKISNSNFTNNNAQFNGGALTIENVEFLDNETGEYIYGSDNNVIIDNTEFNNNSALSGGAAYLYLIDNMTINNSKFNDNNAYVGGAIASEGNDTTILNIDSSDFDSNYAVVGAVLTSQNGEVNINNTNFNENGIPEDADKSTTPNMASAIYKTGNQLNIDNSNFTSNHGGSYGSPVIFEGTGEEDLITINNSLFQNNTALSSTTAKLDENDEIIGYTLTNIAPGVIIDNANGIVDNTLFKENTAETVYPEGISPEDITENITLGIIAFNPTSDEQSCNVTNSHFMNNTPANFEMDENHDIILNITDNYIPETADETNHGETKEYTDGKITDVIIDENNGLYKVIISQNRNSENLGRITFKNNTYYFPLPDRIDVLTINEPFTVLYGADAKINGTYYYMRDGNKTPIVGEPLSLYINGTYVMTTLSGEGGLYEFNYTTSTLGLQTVEVRSLSIPLDKISNTTNFTVTITNTHINIDVNDTKVGNETSIIISVTRDDNSPISNANLTVYVNNEEMNITTGEDGTYTIPYTPDSVGNNHVLAFFPEIIGYNASQNSATFKAEALNTSISLTATNPVVNGKTTINGKLVDENGKAVSNAPITVYVNDKPVPTQTGEDGTFTLEETITTSGENFIEAYYAGNNNYTSSINSTTTTLPETRIEIEVTNSTEGNVEAEITVTDENNQPIAGQTVEVTLPDGTKTNKTTDNAGKIKVTDKNSPAGNAQITATVPATGNIPGASETKPLTITPDYQKIIDELNDTIKEQQGTIDDLNDTVKDQEKTINEQNDTINDLEDTLDKLNKTSVITAVPDNGTVDDNKVVVTLNNKQGTPISNAPITIKNSKGETIGNATTDKNGVAVIPVNTKAGQDNITVTYPGDSKLTPSSTTVSVSTSKNNVTVTVDPVNGVIGENIVLTAHIKDTKGNSVSGGNLVFKLNGKTLRSDGRFDSNATAWKFSVKDGIVTVTIKADLYLRNAKNLTASYSGSYKYEEAKSSVVTAQIKKRDAKITVTSTPKSQKQYNTIKFTAKLTDTTTNHKNTTAINIGTKVLFKVNGKTLKDSKGKQILVKVVNNTATYKYTVPAGMGGITNSGETRDYTVEAVLVSDNYYPDTRSESTFNVQRSQVTIDIAKVSVSSANKLSVKATIKDYKGNNVIGANDVNIKINGKSYVNPKTNKTQNFKVTDGKIDLAGLQVAGGIKIKTVTVVTGARQAYLGARNETSSIVKA